jgi:hypothetical protein
VLSRLLGAFDPDERAQLATLLERFVGEIDHLVAELGAPPEADRAPSA